MLLLCLLLCSYCVFVFVIVFLLCLCVCYCVLIVFLCLLLCSYCVCVFVIVFLLCFCVLLCCLVPRPLPLSQPAKNRRDSQSQLQSLVARVQCGDWPPVLTSLLKDRLQGAGPTAEDQLPRSIYRETLFLNMTVSSGHVDIGEWYHFSPRPIVPPSSPQPSQTHLI